MTDRFVKALALTPDQKTRFDAVMAAHKAPLETKRKASMKEPETKAEDLKTLHRAAADADLDMLLEHRSQRQEIRALLTPEQREKAARLEGRMEGRMQGHKGFRGDGPRGGFPGEGPR